MIEQRFDPNWAHEYVRYGRMSTKGQNERSPDQQFAEIDRILLRSCYPWRFQKEYRDDGISGRYQGKRPAYTQMMEDVKTGRLKKGTLILVDTLERFGRFEELGAVRDMLRNRYGVLILTADTGFADPTTAQGKALGFLESFRATQDASVKAHNVLRGKRDAAERGRWPGGPAPLGYRLEAKIGKTARGKEDVYKTLISVPEDARIVREMYLLAQRHGWGGARIAKELNARKDVMARLGRVHADTVNRILMNPIYRGVLCFNRVSTDVSEDRRVIRPNDEDAFVRVPGFCEPLVTDEMWHAVNDLKVARGKRIKELRAAGKDRQEGAVRPLSAGIALKYPLSGLVRCGSCGASMRPNKSGAQSKHGRTYAYYMCPNHHGGSCANGFYLRMDWLEQVVFATVRRNLFPASEREGEVPPWFAPLMIQVQAELSRIHEARQTSERPMLERELLELNKQVQGWSLSLGDPHLPQQARKKLQEDFASAMDRQHQVTGELESLDRESKQVGEALDPRKVLEGLQKLDEVMRTGNPSTVNVELAQHMDRLEVFPDGSVVMHTFRLGMFQEVVHLLSRPSGSQAADRSSEGDVQRITPRLLGRRATESLTLQGMDESRGAVRPEDPRRFEGMGLDFFWRDEFQAPTHRPWYQAHAADVARLRAQEGLSLVKLAKHFGKSKPTIMKALRHAAEQAAVEEPEAGEARPASAGD